MPLKPGDAAHDGAVVAKLAVSVQLDEAVKDLVDIKARGGSLHVARKLHVVPCRRSCRSSRTCSNSLDAGEIGHAALAQRPGHALVSKQVA